MLSTNLTPDERRLFRGPSALLRPSADVDASQRRPWIVVGGGPSAATGLRRAIADAGPGYRIATCNHGLPLVREVTGKWPDVYALFERTAVGACAAHLQVAMREGIALWVTERAFSGMRDDHGLIEAARAAELALPNFAASAGASLLWAISHREHPSSLRVVGFDAYQIPEAMKRLNREMSVVIGEITCCFSDVPYTMYGKSAMPGQDRWRVERVDL